MSLAMTASEQKNVDKHIEGMLDWASTRHSEAEQLSLDAVRLLSCTSDRLEKTKNQGFFKRCWSRFNGDAGSAERANTADMIQMQKMSFRYINMLQEQQLVMAHSMLSLKNHLYSLAVKEEETRNLIALLAKNTLERFSKLEHRVDQLEISTNLQGWLLSLEERDYDEKYPTEYMRLFRVINDFYTLKNDAWNYNDLMFMRKAIRTVGIDPKRKISLNVFIDSLTDEIGQDGVGFDTYTQAITAFNTQEIKNYSKYAVENISSSVFTSIHGLKIQYMDRLDIVEEFVDQFQITQSEALKRLLRRSIANLGVNLDYQFPLAETAIEILGCIRLVEQLTSAKITNEVGTQKQEAETVNLNVNVIDKPAATEQIDIANNARPPSTAVEKLDINNISMSPWKDVKELPNDTQMESLVFAFGKYYASDEKNIYYSENLNKWQFASSDFGGSLRFLNGMLFCIGAESGSYSIGKNVFVSKNGEDWEQIELPTEVRDESIRYKHVFFINETWCICGEHHVPCTYTKKGFFKDSEEETWYTSATVFYGKDLVSFNEFAFYERFPKFNVKWIEHAGDVLVAELYHEDDYDNAQLVTSKDGINWKKLMEFDEDTNLRGWCTFEDKILCSLYKNDEHNNYEINIQTAKSKKISLTPLIDESPIHRIEGNGKYFYYRMRDKKFYITTDLKKWQQINMPDGTYEGIFSAMYNFERKSNLRKFLLTDGKLIAYAGGAKFCSFS